MALPKKNIISKDKEFRSVFEKGKTVKGSFLFVRIKDNDLGIPRFAFVIAKKKIPKASQRNRLKRVLSEAVRNFMKDNTPKKDFIIIVSKSAEEAILTEELKNLLNK